MFHFIIAALPLSIKIYLFFTQKNFEKTQKLMYLQKNKITVL